MFENTPTPMHSQFPDETSGVDYDDAIIKTRKKMEKMNDPCEAATELLALARNIYTMRSAHTLKPCIEGFCFGVFRPDQSRGRRREETLKGEAEHYQNTCDTLRAYQERQRKRADEIALEKTKLEQAKTELEREKIKLQMKELQIASDLTNNAKGAPSPGFKNT